MIWVYVLVGVVALLGLAFIVMHSLGSRLPKNHVASAKVAVPVAPQAAYDLLSDVDRYPQWAGVTSVEPLPDRSGQRAWRQRMGRNAFVTINTAARPPAEFELTIDDDAQFFSGSWRYTLEPDGPVRTLITLTEHGTIPGAIPRFVMRYLTGYDLYLKKQLSAVSKKLGGGAVSPA
jgi:hypothetical protein